MIPVFALATPNATATTPFSSAFVDDVSSSATIGSWMAPPSNVTAGATISFTSTGAAFHSVQLSRAGTHVWNVTLLDGSTSFSLPAISPDPLGTGSITAAVSAADAPGFDAKAFDVLTTKGKLVRASGAQATFTR